MKSAKKPSALRKRRSSGNVIVESVFTMLPTFAIILMFVDISLMLFRRATLQNAVREGCRYAVTFQTATGLGQDASIEAIVQQFALNFVKTTDSPQHIFVNYYTPTNLNTAVASPGGNVPGNVVEVSVQNISFSWIAPLSGSYGGSVPFLGSTTPISIAVYSSDIMGGYPVGVSSVTR
jgi:Flp pilus assembly protein TadG